jgi:hypothetical protein
VPIFQARWHRTFCAPSPSSFGTYLGQKECGATFLTRTCQPKTPCAKDQVGGIPPISKGPGVRAPPAGGNPGAPVPWPKEGRASCPQDRMRAPGRGIWIPNPDAPPRGAHLITVIKSAPPGAWAPAILPSFFPPWQSGPGPEVPAGKALAPAAGATLPRLPRVMTPPLFWQSGPPAAGPVPSTVRGFLRKGQATPKMVL